MSKELNEMNLEQASGGGLYNSLDIDTIKALGYTLHRYDSDATACPSFELSRCCIDLERFSNPNTCSFCVYSVNPMFGGGPYDVYCMLKL